MTYQLGEWLPYFIFWMGAWTTCFLAFHHQSRRTEEILERIYGDKLDEPFDRDHETPADLMSELVFVAMRNPDLCSQARKQELFLHLHGILFEELLYRAPLVVFFSRFTWLAFLGIAISTGHFAWMHFRGSLGLLMYKAFQDTWAPVVPLRIRLLSVIGPGVLGLGVALLAVGFQSLLLAVTLHIAWNAVMGVVIPRIRIQRAIAKQRREPAFLVN